MNTTLSGTVYCPSCGDAVTFHAGVERITLEGNQIILNTVRDQMGSYNQYKQDHTCKPPRTKKEFDKELNA